MSTSIPHWKKIMKDYMNNTETKKKYDQDEIDHEYIRHTTKYAVKNSPPAKHVDDADLSATNEILDYSGLRQDLHPRLYKENLVTIADELGLRITDINSKPQSKLLKMLLAVMQDLTRSGGNDLILLKHDEARTLYGKYCSLIDEIEKATETLNIIDSKRNHALSKLTAEEKKLLGIKS